MIPSWPPSRYDPDAFLCSVLDPAYADQNNFYGLLNLPATRAAIHVGNISYNDGNIEVEKHLLQDVAASQMSAVVELLDTYNLSVLFYNGNLDIIVKYPHLDPKSFRIPMFFRISKVSLQCGAPLTARWIDAMQWSGREALAGAERWHWCLSRPHYRVMACVQVHLASGCEGRSVRLHARSKEPDSKCGPQCRPLCAHRPARRCPLPDQGICCRCSCSL